MGNDFYFQWEIQLMVWIQQHLGGAGTLLMKLITDFGDATLLVAILGFIYWSYDKKMGKKMAITLITSTFLNPMIKDVFVRRRPYFDHPEVKCLKQVSKEGDLYDVVSQGFSFPSGHAMGSMTAYGTIAKMTGQKMLRAVCVILIILVGISRFSLGVHYPTDVLTGWGCGLIIVFLVPWLQDKIGNDKIFYGLLILICLTGVFYCRDNDYFTALGLIIGFSLGDFWERKHVNFQSAKAPLTAIIRVVGGLLLFVILDEGLKLPFSREFLTSGSLIAFLIRSIRYTIIMFTLIGLYPMTFSRIDKLTGKNKEE